MDGVHLAAMVLVPSEMAFFLAIVQLGGGISSIRLYLWDPDYFGFSITKLGEQFFNKKRESCWMFFFCESSS